jgi:hypothetical protein
MQQNLEVDLRLDVHLALLQFAEREGIPFKTLIERILTEWVAGKKLTAAVWPPKTEKRAGGTGSKPPTNNSRRN